MKRIVIILFSICFLAVTFNSTADSISIDTVVVSDIGNPENYPNGLGTVDYKYRIGTYEVTNSQYASFLNSIASSDPYELYFDGMSGITRTGSSGSYNYSIVSGFDKNPVVSVTWRNAARFTNWLHNGQTNDPLSTEFGAYDTSTFTGTFGSYTDQSTHHSNALYWIPTDSEWYKAAYYDPTLNDGAGGYWKYPTQSDTVDTSMANYSNGVGGVTDIGTYPYTSYYGTYDQAGNVWELVENWFVVGDSRLVRGGSFDQDAANFQSQSFGGYGAMGPEARGSGNIGFRIATVVPEPISSTLFIIGGITLGFKRFWWKRK